MLCMALIFLFMVWIIILIVVYILLAVKYFNPKVDIILQGSKYRIILWYNKYQRYGYQDKKEKIRSYIQLFVI